MIKMTFLNSYSYPLTQSEIWSGVGSFAYIQQLSMFGKFSVHAWRWCRGLNKEEVFISVNSGAKF